MGMGSGIQEDQGIMAENAHIDLKVVDAARIQFIEQDENRKVQFEVFLGGIISEICKGNMNQYTYIDEWLDNKE